MTETSRPIRVYADSSVYGGAFDEEFEAASRTFVDQVRSGRFRLISSSVVSDELENAPDHVKALFAEMEENAEVADVSEDSLRLQEAYLKAGIVSPKWETDALHVALATDSQCKAIISWNFKHIVIFKRFHCTTA